MHFLLFSASAGVKQSNIAAAGARVLECCEFCMHVFMSYRSYTNGSSLSLSNKTNINSRMYTCMDIKRRFISIGCSWIWVHILPVVKRQCYQYTAFPVADPDFSTGGFQRLQGGGDSPEPRHCHYVHATWLFRIVLWQEQYFVCRHGITIWMSEQYESVS